MSVGSLTSLSAWSQQHVFASCLFITVGYLLIVRILRYQRVHSTHAKFPYTSRDDFASMTLEHAFRIQQSLAELEFPFTFHKALQFALFRTYGIPSISELLMHTKQLSTPATAPKRYVDTEVLIVEFCQNHPKSERALAALARMNYLHSIYRRTGSITNENMLYTLSLFALEPIRWINDHEWRQLEPFEVCALGTFWKATGDAMEIDYSCLEGAKKGWKDGLAWLDDVSGWAKIYESDSMKPSPDNHQTAEETTKLLLWYAPGWAKSMGKRLVCTLMDERLRKAMMYDRPPKWCYRLTLVTLTLRKYSLRYLALPRPTMLASNTTARNQNSAGRYHMNTMDALPFYVKPTLLNRYGPSSWLARAVGVPLPEQGKYCSEGFKAEDVGPETMKGKGLDFVQRSQDSIAQMRTNGCPFL